MELMNTRMDLRFPSGLAKHMDVVIFANTKIIYNKPLDQARTIFVQTTVLFRAIHFFVDHILPQLTHPVNVIIAAGDLTFPNNTDLNNQDKGRDPTLKTLGLHPFINKLFVENLDEDIPNTLPIPLGLTKFEGPVTMNFFSKYVNIDPTKPLLCTNFNRTRDGMGQWAERKQVFDLCETEWKPFIAVNENTKTHEEFLEKMGKNAFTLCVHGGGLDVNPKLWEALLIGVIPIIRENKPYTDIYTRENFPVVIVKEWNYQTLNAGNLLMWHQQYYSYFTNPRKRKRMLTQLSLAYWVEYIHCA
jgi:hypothetical protein